MKNDNLTESEIKIITISHLLGPANFSVYLLFFENEKEETVKLCIESLIRKQVLKNKDNKLYLVPGFENMCMPSSLFGILPKEKTFDFIKDSFLAGQIQICGIISLLINNVFPVKETHFHTFIKNGALQKFCPHLDSKTAMTMCLLIRQLVLSCKAVEIKKNKYVANASVCKKICSLTTLELTINILQMLYDKEIDKPMNEFFSFLKDSCLTFTGLESLLKIFLLKYNFRFQCDQIIDLMQCLGVICCNTGYYFCNKKLYEEKEKIQIKCDTNMTLQVQSEYAFDESICLYAKILTCDTVSIWEISKTSFFTALNSGLKSSDIKKSLNYPYYDSIFDNWEKDYFRLKIYDGITVQCTPELDNVISSLKSLQPYIICKITDCVYFFKASEKEVWSEILAKTMNYENLPAFIREEGEKIEEGEETDTQTEELEFFQEKNSKDFSFLKSVLHETEDCKKTEDCKNAQDCKKNPNTTNTLNTTTQWSLDLARNDNLLLETFELGQTESAFGVDIQGKRIVIERAIKNQNSLVCFETLSEKYCAKPIRLFKTQDNDFICKVKILPSGQEKNVILSSVYKVTSLQLSI